MTNAATPTPDAMTGHSIEDQNHSSDRRPPTSGHSVKTGAYGTSPSRSPTAVA